MGGLTLFLVVGKQKHRDTARITEIEHWKIPSSQLSQIIGIASSSASYVFPQSLFLVSLTRQSPTCRWVFVWADRCSPGLEGTGNFPKICVKSRFGHQMIIIIIKTCTVSLDFRPVPGIIEKQTLFSYMQPHSLSTSLSIGFCFGRSWLTAPETSKRQLARDPICELGANNGHEISSGRTCAFSLGFRPVPVIEK